MSGDSEAREAVGEYKAGWHDPENSTIRFDFGLSEEVVRQISELKEEPEWMTDIDGIRTVSEGVNAAIRGTDSAALIITHYSRILEHVQPDRVHVLLDGRIVASGGPELATKLEERGYEWLMEE